jgi:putative ABC transport system substrate-binding protein
VDVIAATGGTRSIQSAKTATSRIPIVFVTGSDPVQLGLVSNIERPSGNLTGVMFFDSVHGAKRIELIKELAPDARVVAALFNPNNPIATTGVSETLTAARDAGLQADILYASDDREIDLAFAAIAERRIGGVVVHADPFLLGARQKIVNMVTRARIAAVYGMREFAEAGGLVSYGTNIVDVFRLCGVYTGRILKGERVANLPVQQARTGELVVNLGKARALGVTIPESVLAKADQVIA